MNRRTVIGFGAVLVIAGGAWFLWGGPADEMPRRPTGGSGMHGETAGAPATPAGGVAVPQLSAAAANGQSLFDESCAVCHGMHGSGTDRGAPLVHKIYEPSHHADFAFVRAVRNGVPAHHWPFGNMPPIEGMSDRQIDWITAYVRELQRANGIE